ncbi:MAG: SMC family ATPase [Cyanobacteria bacterium J06648_16]
MHLISISLTNFKAHQDRHFDFELGTNAICGENGAGKTSLLEGIAWTLFNYQGNYTKEDLIRNGSKSAQVRVAFVSDRDGRTYEVERCTTRGYTLFDPQLNERLPYTRIKDEVMPWLRQHLGVPAGTDLGQLFANTVGVPQGTFTADFLLTPTDRKPVFDNVLKVQEYQQVYKQSIGLKRLAEAEVNRLKDQIDQFDERLEAWETLQQRYETGQKELADNRLQLTQLQAQLVGLQQQRTKLTAQAKDIQATQQQQQSVQAQLGAKQQAAAVVKQSLLRSQQAVELCKTHQPAHAAFLAAEQALKALDQRINARQTLQRQQQTQQQTLDRHQAQIARLQLQQEQRQQTQQALAALAPQITQQQALQQQQQTLQTEQQRLSQHQSQQIAVEKQLQSLTQQQQRLTDRKAKLEALQAEVARLPALEQQQQRLQQQLSRVEAAQQFEQELRQLVDSGQQRQAIHQTEVTAALAAIDSLQSAPMDLIEQIRRAIATGQTLTQTTLKALENILQDLSQQVNEAKLLGDLADVQKQLQMTYRSQAEAASLPTVKAEIADLTQQQQTAQTTLTDLQQSLAQLPHLTQQLTELNQQIQALDDPIGRSRLLQERLEATANINAEFQTAQAQQRELAQTLTDLTQQLVQFEDLDGVLAQQQAQKTEHQPGYLLYLQHQQAANGLAAAAADAKAVEDAIATLQAQFQTLTDQLQTLTAAFDPQAQAELETTYQQLQSQADRLDGSLPQQQKRQQELSEQIAALQTLADRRTQAQADLKQKERVKRFVNFARKVYRDAGPRITERYVHDVSREADRLFRELLNRANVALEWTRDYEILVKEGPHTRRFVNLSGGEQMCAALSVRLALLKTLADIDVAFFDEPTTNMDRSRRESLAEAIARLKSFRQLFVISHDDTFEKVTENVITVTRE